MKKMFGITVGVVFMLTTLAASVHALELTAGATLKVPAERTTKLGPGNDGVIEQNTTFGWVSGTAYNAGGIITFTLNENNELKFVEGAATNDKWRFVYGGNTQSPSISDYAINHEMAAGIAIGTTIDVVPGVTKGLDLSDFSDNTERTHKVEANYYAVGGNIKIDGPDTAPILQTITQYAYADTVTTADTIDAIDNQAFLFLNGNTLSAAHTFTVASTNAFSAGYAPTFQANDQLTVTLSGEKAVDGLENVLIVNGGATLTYPVGAATNEMDILLTNADLLSLGITAGTAARDIAFGIILEAKGDTELSDRIITATPELNLADTGNGIITYQGKKIFSLVQNGTKFRLARFSTADAQVTNTKLTNTSTVSVPVDVRFYAEGSAPTEWVRYDETIPADDSLTIAKEDIMRVLNITDTSLWGFVDFRVATSKKNVTAQAFMRHANSNFAANIPIPYFDATKWSF